MAFIALMSICALGALWSGLYLRFRSLWVPYVSHAIVDVAVFGVGAVLIFGCPA